MFSVLDFADSSWFQQSTPKFVCEPSQKRIDVLAACLEAKHLWVVIGKVTRFGLLVVLG
jgi:hypothetical protein